MKKNWPGKKLKLDKACLRGGYRSLRPLQKSQALCLHGRRRPRRETRREPRMTTGIALSNLYRVREHREGPESLPGLELAGCCFTMYLFATRVGSQLYSCYLRIMLPFARKVHLQIPRSQQLQQRVIVCTKNDSLFKLHVCQPFIVPPPFSCTCVPVASESTFCSPTRGISTSFGSSVVKTLGDDMSYSASCSNGCFGVAAPRRLPAVSRRHHPCQLRCHTYYFLTPCPRPYVHVIGYTGVSAELNVTSASRGLVNSEYVLPVG